MGKAERLEKKINKKAVKRSVYIQKSKERKDREQGKQ